MTVWILGRPARTCVAPLAPSIDSRKWRSAAPTNTFANESILWVPTVIHGGHIAEFGDSFFALHGRASVISRITVLLIVLALTMNLVQADEEWIVREDGVGLVKVGMTLTDLNKVLGEKHSMPKNKEDQGCFYVRSVEHPHVAFMIEDGRLVRVDVDGPGIPTAEGIQIGDSEEHARQVYGGRARVEAHHYIPGGHYLTVRSKDGRYGIRFETEKGKIQRFYAGRFAAVQYVEGCL
jgi:hypothetical protein